MIPFSGRRSPEYHFWLLCRCDGHVHLPAAAQAEMRCRCGRRYIWDLEVLTVTRTDGKLERGGWG